MDTFLDNHDLSCKDVPAFLVVHASLSAAMLSSTWILCYAFAGSHVPMPPLPPLRVPAVRASFDLLPMKAASSALRGGMTTAATTMSPRSIGLATTRAMSNVLLSPPVLHASKSISHQLQHMRFKVDGFAKNSGAVRFLQRRFPNMDTTRLLTSYVEAKIGRMCFGPITGPSQICLSFKAAKRWRIFRDEHNADANYESSSSYSGAFALASLPNSKDTSSCSSKSSAPTSATSGINRKRLQAFVPSSKPSFPC